MARKYTRSFIPLKQERPDYTIKGREATGKCIIETREAAGKLTFSVQDLVPKTIYKVYLVSAGGGQSMGLPLSSLHVDDKGRGEVKWEFNPDDVGGTGMAIEAFNVAAVLFVKAEGIVAPLVGYKDDEVTWKRDFVEYSPKTVPEMNLEMVQEPVQEAVPKAASTIIPEEVREAVPDTAPETISKTIPEAREETSQKPAPVPVQEPPVQEANNQETNQEETDQKAEQRPAPEPEVYQAPPPEADNGINPVHENFKNMAKKIDEQWRELEYYSAAGPESVKIPGQNHDPQTADSLEYLFLTYPKMEPFSHQDKAVIWIRISIRELAYFPHNQWALMHEPFINNAHSKYQHLMMGLHKEGDRRELFLGVPDVYSKETESHARSIGFQQFKTCEGGMAAEGVHGYWIAGTPV